MATIGEAFVDLHFDSKALVGEATRAIKAVLGAAAASGLATIFAGLSASAIGAIPNVAALVTTIASAAPAALVATTAIAALVAEIGVMKLATFGLSYVWKALVKGDMKAFQKGLEKLSPAARAFANELKNIFPKLKYLQQTVQEHFFTQFKGDLTIVSKNLLPTFTKRLRDLAVTSGIAGHHLAEFLSGSYAKKQIDAILVSANRAFGQLIYVPAQLSQAFLAIGTSARFVFQDIATTIASYVTEWTQKIQDSADSGQLRKSIAAGIQVIQQLGGIVADVAVGIKNVFAATASAGASPLAVIREITAKFRELTGSIQGQAAIRDFFIGLKEAAGGAGGAALTQIFHNLLPAIGALLVAIAPLATSLINTLGPALTTIVKLLTPVIQVLGQAFTTALSQLLPALPPVGAALLQVAEAAKPFLNVLGQQLAQVATAIAPVLGPLAQLLSSALQAIVPVLGSLIKALVPVIDAFVKALLPVMPSIQKSFEALAAPLAQIGAALAPIAAVLGQALAEALKDLAPVLPQIVTEMVPLIQQLSEQLVPIIKQLIPYIPDLAKLLGEVLVYALQQLVLLLEQSKPGLGYTLSILKFIGGALDLATQAVTWFVENFGKINGITVLLAYVKTSFDIVMSVVINYIKALIGYWQALWEVAKAVWNGIVWAITTAVNATKKNISDMIAFVKTGITNFVNLVKGIGKTIGDTISGFGKAAYEGGKKLIGGLIDGIKSMISGAVGAVGDVLGAIGNLFPHSPAKEGPFSGRGYTSFSGVAMMQDFASAILSQQSVVRNAALQIANAATIPTPALSSVGPLLASSAAGTSALAAPTTSGQSTVEQLLQQIIDAIGDVGGDVGKEINGSARSTKQSIRGL